MHLDLLLDSHVVLWLLHADPRTPDVVRTSVEDPDSTVSISVASWWELAVKRSLGKLDAPIERARAVFDSTGLLELPIRFEHAIGVGALPFHHRDPFDRLLVAQARVEELTLVTVDRKLAAYDVPIIGLD